MSNSNETIGADSNNINTKQVIKVIGFIVLGVVGFYFANFHNGFSTINGDWGTFGDYIGGILNPVIAAFAFYLIAKTYELQKKN
jgi:large-conductance mechanosensitive channel